MDKRNTNGAQQIICLLPRSTTAVAAVITTMAEVAEIAVASAALSGTAVATQQLLQLVGGCRACDFYGYGRGCIGDGYAICCDCGGCKWRSVAPFLFAGTALYLSYLGTASRSSSQQSRQLMLEYMMITSSPSAMSLDAKKHSMSLSKSLTLRVFQLALGPVL